MGKLDDDRVPKKRSELELNIEALMKGVTDLAKAMSEIQKILVQIQKQQKAGKF